MADRTANLGIKVSADSTQFTAAMDSARDRISKYAAETGRAKEVLANFQSALDESGAATAKQVQQIAKTVMQLDRLAQTAGKTRGELAAMKAENLGISSAMKSYVADIDAATKHTHSFSLANAGAQRELLVLTHELSQGNFKRFGGSLLVLAQRTGAMSAIFNPVTLGIGAITAAAALSVEVTLKAAEALENYGQNIEHISQETGQSTKDVQEWAYAVQSVGLGAKEAAKSLETIGESQNRAAQGNKQAVAAFAALGISMQQVKSENPSDMLLTVADAFQQSRDGAAKAAVATELFGASGEQLIPLLDKGRAGIQQYTSEADRLGGVLSDGTIKQLDALKDHTEQASARMSAMSLSAKAQVIPAIEAITDAFSDNASMGPIITDFYAGTVGSFRAVVTAGATVAVGIEQMVTLVGTLGAEAKDFWNKDFGAMADDAKAGYAKLQTEGSSYLTFTKKLWSDIASTQQNPANTPGTGLKDIHYAKGEKTTAPKVDENALNGELASYQTQIKNIDDSRKEALANLKSQLDSGLLAYKDYYAQAIAANEAAYKQEADIQEKRLKLAQQKKNISAAQEAQQELDRINHERIASAQQLTDELTKTYQQRAQATQDLAVKVNAATQQMRQSYAAQDAEKFMTPDNRNNYAEQVKLFEDFEKQMDAIRKEYSDHKLDEGEFQDRATIVQQGYAEQEELLQQHMAREAAIRNSYSAQILLATNQIATQQKTGAQAVGEAFTSVYDTANSALERFVQTGKFNFDQFTSSVLMNLAQIAERMAMTQIFSALGNSVGGSFGEGLGAMHFADGGHVMGAGSSTSDSIPAMLSNGEFVVNAASTSKYRGLLETINSGQAAHFATGGYVGTADTSSGSSAGSGGDLHFHLDGNARNGLSAQDAKELLPVFQAIVDKRMQQKMTGQGGFSYQMKYGQI